MKILTQTFAALMTTFILSSTLGTQSQAAVANFDITVPNRVVPDPANPAQPADPTRGVVQVDATILTETTGNVTFEVTHPDSASSHSFSFTPATVCSGPPNSNPCVHIFPTPSGSDIVSWTLPDTSLPITDPGRFTYKFSVDLPSNKDTSGGSCTDVTPSPSESFSVAVTAGPQISSACLLSFESTVHLGGTGNCTDQISINPDENHLPVATINGGSDAEQLCQSFRPGVDAALVLDKSGSMNGAPMAGPSGTKIQALRSAVDVFVSRWTAIRGAETSSPADQLGVILFDSDASWLGAATGLDSFSTVAPSVAADLALVNGAGATSIGDGLEVASTALAAGSNRKVVLLMSDGKENTHQRVRLWDTVAGSVLAWSDLNTIPDSDFESRIKIQLGSGATWTDLANEDQLRIYAVTIGSATAVSAEINQGLALATGGFYINSETNADILPVFFVELLQNFVKFNTWDVVALRADKVGDEPYELTFPLTTTSAAASIDLSWNPEFGPLCLDVFGPSSTAPETICNDNDNNPVGAISWSRIFSPATSGVAAGTDWRLRVRGPAGAQRRGVPFFLIAMAEETNLKTDFTVGKGDYTPGSVVPIHVQMTESGRAVTSGINVTATVASPSQSIGDLLAASSAGSQQPSEGDSLTDADAKLQNELSKNPEALQASFNTLNLFDNGDAANGDVAAGDGIYSALYQVDAPGHYNILFNSQGDSRRSGRLHKEQLVSVYVRNHPDPNETEVSTTVSAGSGDAPSSLTVDFKPSTKNGFLMGPGWANYFWLSAPGVTPFKAIDNRDGTYTATTGFSTELPPTLTLHFLDAAMFIPADVGPETLPLPLDQSTAVLSDIESTNIPGGGLSSSIYLALLLLLILLLLVYLLIKYVNKP